MKNTKFTVIIATHQRANLLRRAINSVLCQTLASHQIIVVSDTKDQKTDKVIFKLQRENDIYIQRLGSPGPAASRNMALALATGTHVIFLDDDDTFHSDFLENAQKYIQTDNQDNILYTNFEVKDDQGEASTQAIDLSSQPIDDIWTRNFIPNHCLIYPKISVRNIFFEDDIAYEDWEFILSAYSRTALKHIPIFGPVIHKNSNAKAINRGKSNQDKLQECYLKVYKKHPSRSEAIHNSRGRLLEGMGIDIEQHAIARC